MVSPLLQIVVVGAGLIGPRHATHIQSNPRTKLFGFIDPTQAGQTAATKFETAYYSTISAMILTCDDKGIPYPDGAVICTPNTTHIKIAAELASHGINLLVEKPLSSRAEDSKALKEYTRLKNVKLLVGHHRRFNPFIMETKKNLHRVGEIVAIQGTWALHKPDEYFAAGPWRTDSKTGGGALLINLVHDIDLLQYLFGPIERVYAELLKKQRTQFPCVDEGAVLTLRFKNGICGTFMCSDNVTSPFNFEAGTGENPTIPLHEGLEGFYRVFGSNGTLSIPDFNLYHQTTSNNKHEKSWITPIIKENIIPDRQHTLHSALPFDFQLDHFVDVMTGKVEPFCNADDGMSALLCIDALIKSIESGLPQSVDDVESIDPDYDSLGLDDSSSVLKN